MQTIRLFISSPGDVADERQISGKVIERLQGKYWSLVRLDEVFWEQKVIRSTAHYQDELVNPGDCEIVIGILWSRLGSLMPEKFRKASGERYQSGTEWELEMAFAAYEKSLAETGDLLRAKPDIVIYRRNHMRPVYENPNDEARAAEQVVMLESYFRENYWFPDGTIKRPITPYTTLDDFEAVLSRNLEELILRQIPRLKPGFEPPPISGSPFKGLKTFDFRDSDRYFGRNREIREIQQQLIANAGKGMPFLLIYGGSGYGKSSLMRAGLGPVLTRPGGSLNEIQGWRRVLLQPAKGSGSLCERLARALIQAPTPEEVEDSRHQRHWPLTGLPELSESCAENTPWDSAMLSRHFSDDNQRVFAIAAVVETLESLNRHLLLEIDQLEELFTTSGIDVQQRAVFLRTIGDLCASGRVWAVATMRSEFFPRVAEQPELFALVGKERGYILPPPDRQSLREIIRYPVLAARLDFERRVSDILIAGENAKFEYLHDQILSDAESSPDALPLLEFTLQQLYESRRGALLTWGSYAAIGGLKGAIAHRAREVYDHLSPAARESRHRIFASLVHVDAARGTIARQRTPLEALKSTTASATFLDAFLRNHLLVTDEDSQTGEAIVTLAHEALLTHWDELANWIKDHRGDLLARQRLREQTDLWLQNARTKSYLLSEARLAEAERVVATGLLDLTKEQTEYLHASRKRAALKQRIVQAAMVLFAGLAALAGFFALQSRKQAENALAQTLIAREEEGKAWLERADTYDAKSGMGFHAAMMALRPLGYRGYENPIITNNSSNDDASRADKPSIDLVKKSYSSLFEKNQNLRARAGKLIKDNAADPWPVWRCRMGQATDSLDFSDDGKALICQSWKLDLTTGKIDFTKKESSVPPTRKTSTAAENLAEAMLQDWKENPTIPGDKPLSWAQSPDGNQLIVGYADRTVRDWKGPENYDTILEPETIGEPYETTGGNSHAPSRGIAHHEVAYSPNGKRIASGRITGAIVILDAVTGKVLSTLTVNGSPVTALSFRPDSQILVSGHANGHVQIWDVNLPSSPAETFHSCSESVDSLVFAPDGKSLLVRGSDQVVSLWSISGLMQASRRKIVQHIGQINDLRIDQKNGILISEDNLKAYMHNYVWDLQSEFWMGRITYPSEETSIVAHHEPSFIQEVLNDYAKNWSPFLSEKKDTGLAVKVREEVFDGIDLVDGATGVVLRSLEKTKLVFFENAESMMVTVDADEVVTLWERPLGKKLDSFVLDDYSEITSVHVSPDQSMMALGTARGEVHLWDHWDKKLLGRLQSGEVFDISALAFAPRSDKIFAGTSNGAIYVWDLHHEKINMAHYLTEGWVTLDGKNVQWGNVPLTSHNSPVTQFVHLSPSSHLGILRSGMPEGEVDERLFWSYLRARNWSGAVALYSTFKETSLRYKAMGSLIQWLRSDLTDGLISPALAQVRTMSLRAILQEDTDDAKGLWISLLADGPVHHVATNETYDSIAADLGILPYELLSYNEGKTISSGIELRIPPFRVIAVEGDFDVETFATNHGSTVDQLADLNGWDMQEYLNPALALVSLKSATPEAKPALRLHIVKEIITMGALARKLGTTVEMLNTLNGFNLTPETTLATGSELYYPEKQP